MGEEKLDNTVYYIRGLYDYADMARSAGQAGRGRAEARADALAAGSRTRGGSRPSSSTRLAARPGQREDQPEALDRVDPMEVELFRDGEFVPGLAAYANGSRALATRENACYSGERPATAACSTRAAPAARRARASSRSSRSTPASRAVGEGNYGRLGPEQQRRYTDANAETQFAQPATGGTPDEQPGAMPEIMPSYAPDRTVGTAPNIERCWTCRSMFMQAWGHYGTAWPVVHQQLGVRPHLGREWLEVVPQVPDGQASVQGEDIRLGGGSADVLASRSGARHTTVTDTSSAPGRHVPHRHTLPRGSTVASVELDGRPAAGHQARETNRGLEVRVPADPGSATRSSSRRPLSHLCGPELPRGRSGSRCCGAPDPGRARPCSDSSRASSCSSSSSTSSAPAGQAAAGVARRPRAEVRPGCGCRRPRGSRCQACRP
jgi:hypothetical protein